MIQAIAVRKPLPQARNKLPIQNYKVSFSIRLDALARGIAHMKHPIIAVIFLATLLWMSSTAEALWLIDAERFHFGVHGKMSCQECHEDIHEKTLHPDPGDVNKALIDFFQMEQCTACHEDVAEEIEEGSHAGEEATAWQRFENCIECHDPHYQVSAEDSDAVPDPNQPATEKCSRCHEFQPELPAFPEHDQTCLECHFVDTGNVPESAEQTAEFCLHCHSSESRYSGSQRYSFPLIDKAQYETAPHGDVSCMVCHPESAEFGHSNQTGGDCRQCHQPHDESIAHDAHTSVTCGACHLNAVTPARDRDLGHIGWKNPRYANRISPIHQMQKPEKEDSCRTCHAKDNIIGAAAMVLPAKSVICMPCHAATLAIGDTITVSSLFLFIFGFVAVGSVWFAGGDPSVGAGRKLKESLAAVCRSLVSIRFFTIVKIIILDGLLQRRLFRISRERWLLHALIFYPFIFRFTWGIAALLTSLLRPDWPGTWALIDKNHPLTAFLFDLSGVMVLVGIAGMIMRRFQKRADKNVLGLPAADWAAYALLGGIMLGGFLLEGMRMAMTGSPDGAPYAFVGDAISRMLSGIELTHFYGYVWYLHAILTGAFVVYLPFSRMFHMIIAPLSLAMNAASEKHS